MTEPEFNDADTFQTPQIPVEEALIIEVDGFEGPLNAQAVRGAAAGWKAAGLPWRQT